MHFPHCCDLYVSFFLFFFSPPSCYIMRFLGCYLTIATTLAKMKIVTWVIPYARDGSDTSAGWAGEVLTLRLSHGLGDTLTSPARSGTKSKLGFLPWPGHSVALCRHVWAVWHHPMAAARLCSVAMAWLGSKLCPGKGQAEPGPLSLVSSSWQHGSWIPTLWCLVMLEMRSNQFQGGNLTAWGCQGEEESVTPQDKKQGGIRHLEWQDLRKKEVAAKAGEEKWLESVKAADRGGRGCIAGRGETCFKMTGTIWFMLTHSTSQFGRSANKLGHLMQALLRETWKNG